MSPDQLVQVLLADNPSPMTGRGTNTYVVGHDDVLVIDPGPADSSHLDRVENAVRQRGRAGTVLLTHHHLDHSESAAEFATRLDVPLAAIPHPEMPQLDTDLADSDQVTFGGGALQVVATPGHTRGHACFWWESERVVFAGDLVAGEGFIVIDPPDGNMADYMASLARVRDLDAAALRPGHGPAIASPRAYLESYIRHRLEREARVLGALGTDPRIIPQLVPAAYDDTPEAMYPIAARSLVAHLEKLAADGKVEIVTAGPETAYRLKE
ncbi:MAG TPA: MBL fold metallo-hydrolase [Myxococcaceae bacterium]|nr:MBL fold metallo-hydrolase [Myxococcaceae bacterium]